MSGTHIFFLIYGVYKGHPKKLTAQDFQPIFRDMGYISYLQYTPKKILYIALAQMIRIRIIDRKLYRFTQYLIPQFRPGCRFYGYNRIPIPARIDSFQKVRYPTKLDEWDRPGYYSDIKTANCFHEIYRDIRY